MKEIVERDARYIARDLARMVGISLSRVHYIRLLTDGQKKQRVKIAKQFFKIYDEKKFANVVPGDET